MTSWSHACERPVGFRASSAWSNARGSGIHLHLAGRRFFLSKWQLYFYLIHTCGPFLANTGQSVAPHKLGTI